MFWLTTYFKYPLSREGVMESAICRESTMLQAVLRTGVRTNGELVPRVPAPCGCLLPDTKKSFPSFRSSSGAHCSRANDLLNKNSAAPLPACPVHGCQNRLGIGSSFGDVGGCEGCGSLHLIADNLGWFEKDGVYKGKNVNVETLLAEKGE